MAAKRIRIKSCRDSQYWYADYIGHWFELRYITTSEILVVDHQGFVNYVHPDDAFVLEPDHDC